MEGLMLIVDDIEINREILRVLFETEYDIMTASSGEEALEILKACEGSINIVLLDLKMPGESGIDILRRRPQLDYFKSVPVVVITASDSMEDQLQAFELGANDYVLKPFIPEIVKSRVNNVMASFRRLEAVQKEANKLRVKSETDEMTGLFNKATTELLVDERLKKDSNQLDALMVIDIDNFKTVNDTSGHQAGDKVLKIVSNLISSRFRKTDYVGRIGGDEFCVLMVDVPSMDIVYEKANELVQVMRYKPNLTIPEYVTISIGVSSNGRKPSSYAELFDHADKALYLAKNNGRAQYQEYGHDSKALDTGGPDVMLISNSRSICSGVHALLPPGIKFAEQLDVNHIDTLPTSDRDSIAMFLVDVSNESGDADRVWKQLESYDWIDMQNVFAICQEGLVSQYISALKHGIADMFTAPLEPEAFKRRTRRHLEMMGVIKKN